MTKHTPTPWEIKHETDSDNKRHVYLVGDYYVAEVLPISKTQESLQKANTEFIVQAVNSHDKLVAACEAALLCLNDPDDDHFKTEALKTTLENAIKGAL